MSEMRLPENVKKADPNPARPEPELLFTDFRFSGFEKLIRVGFGSGRVVFWTNI